MTPHRRALAAALLLAGLAAPALAQGDPSFRLNNRGGETISQVFVSASATSNWGPDRLGANVLQPGQYLLVRLPAGQCVNDIRVVYATGRAREWRRQNTCQIVDFNVD